MLTEKTHRIHSQPELTLSHAMKGSHSVLATLPDVAGVVVVGALVHVHANPRCAGLESVLQICFCSSIHSGQL